MVRRRSQLGLSTIAAVLLACAGCGAPAGQWTKPGATQQQRMQELQACDENAAQWGATPYFDPRRGQIISSPKDASQTQAACMMRRGWTLSP